MMPSSVNRAKARHAGTVGVEAHEGVEALLLDDKAGGVG